MLVIPEETYEQNISDNLSEKTPKEDLKEYFLKTINHDRFYENMNFDDFMYGKKNEIELEKDLN